METSGFDFNFLFASTEDAPPLPGIAPCHFCGCPDDFVMGYARGLSGDLRMAVSCPACKAKGPEAGSKIEAIRAWNSARKR